MAKKSLKERTTIGIFWNFLEKFSVSAGQFVIGIVLARLLVPEDFGLIGMLSIFIAMSQTFIDSGMGSGLIQKQEKSINDYSTVFVFNLLVSGAAYLILFFSAPFIADFYQRPILVPLTRSLSLVLILGALSIIQRTKLTIDMDFKTHAKVNSISLILGGGLGIITALYGYGVWALVVKTLLISGLQTIGYWMVGNWSLSFQFSKRSFRELFGYGSNLLAASLYAQLLSELYNIVIGRAYNAVELGYYTQMKKTGDIVASTITSVIRQVTFPLLASLQKDKVRLVSIFRRTIKMVAFVIIPTMTLLALLAEPLIIFLLGNKWQPVAPLLQLYCIAKLFYPMLTINLNILKATGRSDLFLKIDLIKFPLLIGTLLVTVPISVKAMVIGQIFVVLISSYMNCYYSGKYFNYGYLKQVKDMAPFIVATAGMGIVVFGALLNIDSNALKLLTGIPVGLITYTAIAYFMKLEEVNEFKYLIHNFLLKKLDNNRNG